jgi:hypothetical protein
LIIYYKRGWGGWSISIGGMVVGHRGGSATPDSVEFNSPSEVVLFVKTGPTSEMSKGGVGPSGGQSDFSGSLTIGISSFTNTGAMGEVTASREEITVYLLFMASF